MNKRGTEKKTEKGMGIGTKIDGKKYRKNKHNRSEKRQKKSGLPVIDEETLFYFCMVVFWSAGFRIVFAYRCCCQFPSSQDKRISFQIDRQN